MATKAPSAASLKRQIVELTAQVENLTKELKSSQDTKDYYAKLNTEGNAEISAVHDVLDVLPNVISRKKEDSYSEHKLMTRLASFLASRG